jgi:N-acetylglucosamine-6-sulfatase
MPKTKRALADQGTTAERFYAHTPICNPSRAEILSGRYFHNIKRPGGKLWSMHVNESKVEKENFVRDLHDAGYTTALIGKYLNTMPNEVPPGFDVWLANDGGTYIAPWFQMYNTSFLEMEGLTMAHRDHHECWNDKFSDDNATTTRRLHENNELYGCFYGTTDASNYSTAVIGNASMAFIRRAVENDPTRPFFAYIAPKAAHEPFNPAPWYQDHWDDSWPLHEPRNNPAWNASAELRAGKHGIIPNMPMLTQDAADVIQDVFKNRWRTLMSVDDLIHDVVSLCEDLGVAEHTYFFFSSDHGFQLGQNNILMDKRQVYEFNTRVHLLARGPGIPSGGTWSQPATHVDLAATFLGIGGVRHDDDRFDGKSLAPLIIGGGGTLGNGSNGSNGARVPKATRSHVDDLNRRATEKTLMTKRTVQHHHNGSDSSISIQGAYAESWRDHVFFEYYFVNDNDKCVSGCPKLQPWEEYPVFDSFCGVLKKGHNRQCWSGKNWGCKHCYPTESTANNYIAVRFMPGSDHGDTLYVEYQQGNMYRRYKHDGSVGNSDVNFTRVDWVELYNNTADPWQMVNLVGNPSVYKGGQKSDVLRSWLECKGSTCH